MIVKKNKSRAVDNIMLRWKVESTGEAIAILEKEDALRRWILAGGLEHINWVTI